MPVRQKKEPRLLGEALLPVVVTAERAEAAGEQKVILIILVMVQVADWLVILVPVLSPARLCRELNLPWKFHQLKV